jgi:non-canonical (house-cleaning) NTP pyrophosphatase
MYKLAIGTVSEYKINAIKRAFADLDISIDPIAFKADSGVSEQPRAEGETKLGSINRAKAAMENNPNCDAAIGVEFGYEPVEGKWHMVCWATIVTKKEAEIYSEQSSTLELPKALTDALNKDIDIDSKLTVLLEHLPNTEAARQYQAFIKKRRVIYECVTNVVLRWIFDELYTD